MLLVLNKTQLTQMILCPATLLNLLALVSFCLLVNWNACGFLHHNYHKREVLLFLFSIERHVFFFLVFVALLKL